MSSILEFMETKKIPFKWKSWQAIRVGLILLLTVALLGPALLELFENWSTNDDFSHGFFVLPTVAYLIWRKRDKLLEIDSKPLWIGFPLLLASTTLYYIGMSVRFHMLAYASMLLVLFSLILFLTGWRVTRLLLLPLCFLVFMIPIPTAYYLVITNPIKLLITAASSKIIDGLGIPIYRDGNLLFLANARLEVAEACSGIRSLYSYLMLGCTFASISRSNYIGAVVMVSAFPLSFLMNLLRVTTTGILAHYFGQGVSDGFFHSFSGMLLFLIGFGVLLAEWNMLERRYKDSVWSASGI